MGGRRGDIRKGGGGGIREMWRAVAAVREEHVVSEMICAWNISIYILALSIYPPSFPFSSCRYWPHFPPFVRRLILSQVTASGKEGGREGGGKEGVIYSETKGMIPSSMSIEELS